MNRLRPNPLSFSIALFSFTSFAHLNAQEQNNPQTEQSENFRLEEMLITAQKRSESLQDVPLSVATLSGDQLVDKGVVNLEGLTLYLPNIHFTQTGFSTQVRVRGIGSDNSQGFEQSVGMYIDGIYYGRAQLFRSPLMDMERAELLRGPQSILFGKNSVAGALNLTTAKPTEDFEGKISVKQEFEADGTEVNGVVSGGITDAVRGRLAVRFFEEDGYYDNTFLGTEEANNEEVTVRAIVDWSVNDDFELSFKYENNTFDTIGRAIELTQDIPLIPGGASYTDTLQVLNQPVNDSELNFQRQTNDDEFSNNEIENITVRGDYSFGDHTLTFVTGLLEFNYNEFCDCDFVASEILPLELIEDYQQFSQEIRLVSPVGEKLEWIAGAFYQDYSQEFDDILRLSESNLLPALNPTLAPLANTGVLRDFSQDSESWAVFGHVKYNFTDTFRGTFGARYTEETKEATKVINLISPPDPATVIPSDAPNAFSLGALYNAVFAIETEQFLGHNLADSRKERLFDPLVVLEYDATPEVLTYASYTTGSKAGGFDPRSNNVASFEFDAEDAEAFELGMKSTTADGRVEFNFAIYRTEYEDLQISQFDGAVGFNVGNADARVQGIELDSRFALNEEWTASYSFAWLNFTYTDFRNGNCFVGQTPDGLDTDGDGTLDTCDYTGLRGVYTPDYTMNLSLNYVKPIGPLNFVGLLNVRRVDNQNVHVNLDPNGVIDAYNLLDLRLGIEGDNWEIAALGKNLLDEEVISFSANAPLSDSNFGTNTFYSFVRRPASFSIEGTYKF